MEVGFGLFASKVTIYRRHSCFVASKAGILSPLTIERAEQKSRKW